MHTLNLGIFQTLAAEGLLWLAENKVFEAGPDVPSQLHSAYVRFRTWLRSNCIGCSTRRWTVASIHLTGDDFPWLSCKAFNCRIVLAFLAAALIRTAASPSTRTVPCASKHIA